jgi:hypothetical protein
MNTVKSYASKLTDLPEPTAGEWTADDVPPHIAAKLQFFENRSVIERVPTSRRGTSKWTTPPKIWDALRRLEAFRETDNTLPCGHIGITNLRGDPRYECKTCEAKYHRHELPESMGGSPVAE